MAILKKILVNTANCGVWRDVLEKPLNSKTFKEDIFYVNNIRELDKLKDMKKPFFSKAYLVYYFVEAYDEKLVSDRIYNENGIYIFLVSNMEVYEKLKAKVSFDKELNTYLIKKDILKEYIKDRVPNLTSKELDKVVKKLGFKVNHIDEVISKLVNNSAIPNYNQISVRRLLHLVLLKKANVKCYKLVYSYRYNPRFLINLINKQLKEIIDFKINYNNGEVNAFNMFDKMKELKFNKGKIREYVYLCEHVSLDEMLHYQSMLKTYSHDYFTLYLTLYKFIKGVE